jgi:HD superfamily phosphohydrolase
MPIQDFPSVLEIKDPIHGYVGLSELERKIVDLRLSQRLRYIRSPTGIHLVFPGADSSLMGRMLGVMHVTEVFVENLDGSLEEVEKARLASMFYSLAFGPWANVMDEYLSVRGFNRRKMATMVLESDPISEIIEESTYSLSEVKDLLVKGVPIKGIKVDLLTTPINPELVDNLERDAYFAGVEYAQLEFRRLFSATRIAKNKIAFERGALFTLESYLSAAANMFDAVYYHKTVRAAELMLLRVMDEAGSGILPFPGEDLDSFLLADDLTAHDILLSVTPDDSENMRTANRIFLDFRKRHLVKLVSERSISDVAFLSKIATPDGLFEIEQEVADASGIDSKNLYIDYPNRTSVNYTPTSHDLSDLVLYERGSKGYEFWAVEEHSGIARSFGRKFSTIRVYTTRGYRSKVRKHADALLESIDTPGSS